MSNKPRSDSKLDALPPEQKLELRDGLLRGWSYDAAIAWLRDVCGVTVYQSSLSAFYKRHCKPVELERRQLAAIKAEVIAEEAGKIDWDFAMVEKLKQTVFEFMSNPSADIAETEKLFKLLLKHNALQSGRLV